MFLVLAMTALLVGLKDRYVYFSFRLQFSPLPYVITPHSKAVLSLNQEAERGSMCAICMFFLSVSQRVGFLQKSRHNRVRPANSSLALFMLHAHLAWCDY